MIHLYNQDCMEAMATMEDNQFDLAIVDPPYGINIADWDKNIPTSEYFFELFRVSKEQIIWGANYFHLPHKEGWLCWHKLKGLNGGLGTQSEFELAWTSFLKKAKYIGLTYYGNTMGWDKPKPNYKAPPRIHPTQKPVALYTWLLDKYAQKGWKILDTHLGSGSSAIAAHDMGYEFHGYELDEEYFEAASKRLKEHQKQLQLF
jgi:site-specific DNA-methyltransferase (adenine-specific)